MKMMPVVTDRELDKALSLDTKERVHCVELLADDLRMEINNDSYIDWTVGEKWAFTAEQNRVIALIDKALISLGCNKGTTVLINISW